MQEVPNILSSFLPGTNLSKAHELLHSLGNPLVAIKILFFEY